MFASLEDALFKLGVTLHGKICSEASFIFYFFYKLDPFENGGIKGKKKNSINVHLFTLILHCKYLGSSSFTTL